MHLKSLTLKGFKSFASATTLRFEPGITCVVGPNGSGKSNVVDALTWVMGEQGAKALRGGKMEDVIFAGTSGRAPLGRAEVTLTIDNSDGALPIDYSEDPRFEAGGVSLDNMHHSGGVSGVVARIRPRAAVPGSAKAARPATTDTTPCATAQPQPGRSPRCRIPSTTATTPSTSAYAAKT